MKQPCKYLFIIGTFFLLTITGFSYSFAQELTLTPNPPDGKAPTVSATDDKPSNAPAFNPQIDKQPPRPNHPPIDQIPPMPMPELQQNGSNAIAPELVSPVSYDTQTKQTSTGIPGETGGFGDKAWGGGYCGSDGDCGSEMLPADMGCMTKITNEQDAPWRMNAKVIMRFGSGWFVCSGSMYDAETVLTAGHCLYDTGTNMWADEVWVYPGWDGNDPYPYSDSTPYINHYGYGYANQLWSFSGWTANHDVNYDIGMIDLNRAAGMLTGWFGWVTYGTCPTSVTFNSASYPAENCGQTGLHNGRDMYYWSGLFNYCPTWNTIGIYTPGADNCLCAVWGGMSGSSAYFLNGDSRYIHAVTSRSDRNTVAEYTRLWDAGVTSFSDIINTNIRTSTFDLQPLDMNAEPATIQAGQSTTLLNHKAVNATNGTKNATFNFGVYLSTDDTITSSDTLLSAQNYNFNFAAMQTVTVNMVQVTIPANTSAGNYWLGVIYDAATDGNTSNNSTNTWDAVPITVTPPPVDLVVQSITTNPVSPCFGQSTEVTVTVKNQGAVAAGRFFVTFFQNSATTPPMCDAGTYYWDIAGGLAAGATTNLTTTITYGAPGTFKMWAIADACTEVAETNENNNMLNIDITVLDCGQPDLVVQSITTNPVNPNAGDIVTVFITFANMGDADAPYGFSLDFYKNRNTAPGLGEVGDVEQNFPSSMPCCGYTYQTQFTVVYDDCGLSKMWAQIDTYNAVAESNENNNVVGPQDINVCNDCPNYDHIQFLVRQYYLAILDREPEPDGWAYWTNETCRITKLPIYIGEGFQGEARFFFNSAEYTNKNKTNAQFVTDLYQTFLQREPDAGGLTYWTGQLSAGLTRAMLITSFAYCDEFKAYMTTQFGADTTRPENNMVNDFYRGFLNRFPDDGGFNSWLTQMRQAQCTGQAAVRDLSYQLSLLYVNSAEYAGRNRNNAQYVEDLYNAILKRGADPAGFQAWVNNLNNGMTRQQALKFFTDSSEFQRRVNAVIAAGCYGSCQAKQCGTYTYDCNPNNPNCFCAKTAEGGSVCTPNTICSLGTQCPNGTVDCPAGTVCQVETCCGVPLCFPAECPDQHLKFFLLKVS